jgi:hypothetical protein
LQIIVDDAARYDRSSRIFCWLKMQKEKIKIYFLVTGRLPGSFLSNLYRSKVPSLLNNCNMTTSPTAVKHSPLTRTQNFLMQDIPSLTLLACSHPNGENIEEKLLAADLVESPVSFSESFYSTTSASAEETVTMLSAEEEGEGECGIDEKVPLHSWQYPFVSLPATDNESIVTHEHSKIESATETNTLSSSLEVGFKRRREDIPEKPFAAFATSAAATEVISSHGFAILPPAITLFQQQCEGLQLLSNVSGASSESANTNTFSYPTLGSLSKMAAVPSEHKPKFEGCKCQQSQCLKLYCACFREGKICLDSCKCVSCANTEAESVTDGRLTVARRELLKKKPNAFGEKSCRCSKTMCLKFYCVCFASGNPCRDSCKCEICKNPQGVRSLPFRPNNAGATEEKLEDATF